MRKKNFVYALEHIFIYILMLLPILLVLFSSFTADNADIWAYFQHYNGYMANTFVYDVINDCFGVGGVLPLVNSSTAYIIDYISYCGLLYFVLIIIDFVTFMPKLLHNLMHRGMPDEK